ncbi:class A beta-lactamase [Luteimonas terrae]|uniref:beta-lactamase n=1 Tax=Luteimonas terrae TaxID=1530191 RepID=A0ABU1XT50_9GAMM|nr:class A beta-lactamase [Luteimonas terrae]MDR7191743.1 beta-lactamase class A [Luteimonas terrae]
MHGRRSFLKTAGSAALLTAVAPLIASLADAEISAVQTAVDPAALETASGGRLGMCLVHPERGQVMVHRAREAFPTASTIKFALSAAVLAQADAGALSLDDRIPVRAQDVRSGAPVSGRHVGKDITVRDLCRGGMVWSDNPAVRLLLPLVGGEAGLQAFLRGHGDMETDPRGIIDGSSTTTPQAMAHNLRWFVLEDALSRPSRLQLADWLIENRTGDARIRAAMPEGWRVGDKTGGMQGVSNDIAVLWPLHGGAPWILTLYLRDSSLDAAGRDAVLRRATELAAVHLAAG